MFVLLLFSLKVFAVDEIVIVKLRSPRNIQDARYDPYYDLGVDACFGITRCHRTNIMHPERFIQNLVGRRVAFVQQGIDSNVSQQRLILLTPVLTDGDFEIIGHETHNRVGVIHWNGDRIRPFKFSFAPVLVSNDGAGVTPLVKLSESTRRGSIVAGFGSLFRTRVKSIQGAVAEQIVKLWHEAISHSEENYFAENYYQTMNPPPKYIDTDRVASYQMHAKKACSQLLKVEGRIRKNS